MTEQELIEDMAHILRLLPEAIDELNEEWGKEYNDAAFTAALNTVEKLAAQARKLSKVALQEISQKKI